MTPDIIHLFWLLAGTGIGFATAALVTIWRNDK